MGRISTAFNWSIKQGATTNRPFDSYEIPAKVYGTPYYLTLEERNAVYDMDLSDDPALASHRDVFMFQCLVGCRYSDLVRLTSDNIVNGAVEYIPHKTREKNPRTVRVPLKRKGAGHTGTPAKQTTDNQDAHSSQRYRQIQHSHTEAAYTGRHHT